MKLISNINNIIYIILRYKLLISLFLFPFISTYADNLSPKSSNDINIIAEIYDLTEILEKPLMNNLKRIIKKYIETKIKSDDTNELPPDLCIQGSLALAKSLSTLTGIPVNDPNKSLRFETIWGVYDNNPNERIGDSDFNDHQWIILYIDNKPVLYIDPTFWQFREKGKKRKKILITKFSNMPNNLYEYNINYLDLVTSKLIEKDSNKILQNIIKHFKKKIRANRVYENNAIPGEFSKSIDIYIDIEEIYKDIRLNKQTKLLPIEADLITSYFTYFFNKLEKISS